MPDRPTVYLDYNASAPLRPGVLEAMLEALREGGNASSVHRVGRRARHLIEDARARVAALVGAAPEQVVFTGSGSEQPGPGDGRRRADPDLGDRARP